MEPELYNCETCEVGAQLDGLWPENADAWDLFHGAVTRFGVDTHTVSLSLRSALDGDDPSLVADSLRRCALIYDALYPPPKAK